MTPTDHLPATLRDSDCIRRDEEIERRKKLFRQARGVSSALRSMTDRQPRGQLTRADGAILSQLVLANLRACTRREGFYRPTRAGIAKATGYTPRTVSQSIGRIKKAGIVVVARYAKGGRLGDKGKGLSTEFRSGCLQFVCDQLESLGYRLPKSLREDLVDLGRWAAKQVGETTEPRSDFFGPAKPTGKKVLGTSGVPDRAAPGYSRPAPAVGVAGARRDGGGGATRRPSLGQLSQAASPSAPRGKAFAGDLAWIGRERTELRPGFGADPRVLPPVRGPIWAC